ncbi:uncharacterized protein [Dermacentor albipictus]|uniref:uncharacterized protein isoform X2 n=1 Tax=Dermacentor albipictus TaxID=60249 RepID=UPI0038FD287F
MPVENKTPPSPDAAQPAATPARHSRCHSPKAGHHRKHGNVHGTRQAPKTDRELKGQEKTTGKDGDAPATRRMSTSAEQGPRDLQTRELTVDDRSEAPAAAVTGRLITARPAFMPPVGTDQQGPSKQETSKLAPPDTLVGQSRSPMETGETPNISPAIDRERGRTLKCSSAVSTVVCCSVVFAVASITVAAIIAMKKAVQSYAALRMRQHLVEELGNICETHGCRQALWLINASCRASLDICDDFYGFLCSRWDWKAPTGTKALSYSKIHGYNYSSLVDEALFARTLSSPQAKGTDGYNIALVYSSCVNFLANTTTNLNNMFQAASVNPRAFLEVNDFSQLFSLTIQTVVATRLTSVVTVVYLTTNATVGVLTGTSMRSASFIPEIQKALLEQLASSLGDRRVSKMVDAIEKLDELIQNITEPHLKNTGLNEALTARADFPAHGVYWKDVLKEYVLPRSKRFLVARTNSERAIQSIVQKLASAPLEVAKVYLILVPFARYLSFELKVASRRGFLLDYMKANMCVRYLYAMFGTRAHAVLMEVMGSSKAAVRSRQMWRNLKRKSQVLVEVGAGFTLSKDALLNATLKSHSDNVKPDVNGVLRAQYGSDFMANLIMLAKYAVKQTELNPSLLPMESEAEVATEHLVPDFYYDSATEASVNYGTLGGYMARMLFAAGFPKIYSPTYVDCLDKYTQHHGIPFEKRDWQRYVKMQWSMNVAFESLPKESTARSPVLQERFFFLRYAIFFCGEDAPVKNSLQYAVKTSRSFATAFNCYEPPKNPCV